MDENQLNRAIHESLKNDWVIRDYGILKEEIARISQIITKAVKAELINNSEGSEGLMNVDDDEESTVVVIDKLL